MRVGGSDNGALERFQALREEARRRMDPGEAAKVGGGNRQALTELVRRKQAELGEVPRRASAPEAGSVRPAAVRSTEARPVAPAFPAARYQQSPEVKPEENRRRLLGNYVDMMA